MGFGSLDTCSKREGKKEALRDVSTPMEFTSSVSAHWPSSLLNGSWCMEASQICFYPETHTCLLLTRAPRQQERGAVTWPTQKMLHQSKILSLLDPELDPVGPN
jgi:hypothetical protein